MPEGYTHFRTANMAACFAKIKIADKTAFVAGANGPDTFFCYRAWTKKREIDLIKIGNRLHHENCGEFLKSLVLNAKTDAQKSYAQGFLCHYALDTVAHPYVEFLASKGQAYDMPKGHGFYEIALDTALFEGDYGHRTRFYNITCPHLITTSLAEVSAQLKASFQTVFNLSVKTDAIADSFHHFYTLHRFFYSRFGIKKLFLKIAELIIFKAGGYVTCHIMPTKLKKDLPEQWVHTVTGKKFDGGIRTLLAEGTKLSVKLLRTAEKYWDGKITIEEFCTVVGNKNYVTGLPL